MDSGSSLVERVGRYLQTIDALYAELYTRLMVAVNEVYESIKEAIIDGRLRPNQTLREAALATDLGVSRTPIREAFRRLHSEGLIERDVGRTARVGDLTAQDLTEVFEIRRALEAMVLRRACSRRTTAALAPLYDICEEARAAVHDGDVPLLTSLNGEFHAGLVALSGSVRLESLLSRLRDQSRRYRVLALYDHSEQLQSVTEHKAFLDCIKDNRADDAVALLETHLDRPLRRMLPVLGAGALPEPTPAGVRPDAEIGG